MSTQKGTAWIQILDKEGLISELKKRGIEFEDDSKFNELRELLRQAVKKESSKQEENPASNNNSEASQVVNTGDDLENNNSKTSTSTDLDYKEASDFESENECDTDEMVSDGVKLEFCLNKDDWETFVERVELYFTARDIKEEKQAAQMLTRLDEDAFKLIK